MTAVFTMLGSDPARAGKLGRESDSREIGYGLIWALISPSLLASVWTFT
jgi:hypothetical protein